MRPVKLSRLYRHSHFQAGQGGARNSSILWARLEWLELVWQDNCTVPTLRTQTAALAGSSCMTAAPCAACILHSLSSVLVVLKATRASRSVRISCQIWPHNEEKQIMFHYFLLQQRRNERTAMSAAFGFTSCEMQEYQRFKDRDTVRLCESSHSSSGVWVDLHDGQRSSGLQPVLTTGRTSCTSETKECLCARGDQKVYGIHLYCGKSASCPDGGDAEQRQQGRWTFWDENLNVKR